MFTASKARRGRRGHTEKKKKPRISIDSSWERPSPLPRNGTRPTPPPSNRGPRKRKVSGGGDRRTSGKSKTSLKRATKEKKPKKIASTAQRINKYRVAKRVARRRKHEGNGYYAPGLVLSAPIGLEPGSG